MAHEALLVAVGARVRSARESLGWSRRRLAEVSGVSERFLSQLESGQGNISLRRFADVAAALGVSPAELMGGAEAGAQTRGVVALLGVRGAGKSTIGAQVAAQFGVAFVEVDSRIEQAAGLSLSEIFELHGEVYYRRTEREVLKRLLSEPRSMVLATGGSIVNDSANYELLRQRAYTIWLRAAPEDHWNRVIQQGDARPMAKNPHALSELRALLAARAPLYAEAHLTVDTSGRGIDEVVEAVAHAVQGKLHHTQ